MDFIYDFQPRQIVCLEHESSHLYAEVIQVVQSRTMCWVRPLLLAEFPSSDRYKSLIYDLRSTADLVWSLTLFRPALDTEVIPLIALLASAPQLDSDPVALKQLNQFMHKVWQANQERSEENSYEF